MVSQPELPAQGIEFVLYHSLDADSKAAEMNHLEFLRKQAAKGGKAGTGKAKARTTAQARAAALKRWKGKKKR